MENREDILDALTNFEKKPSGEIPELLEEYLRQVAKSGETIYPWHRLKRLFVTKLDHIIMEFHHETPADSVPTYPNVDNVPFEDMRRRILDTLEKFHGAPFTVQRISELITDPKKHYKRSDKFLRGIEKNVMVVSTVDPFGRKIVSEPPKVMVNGLDLNGYENEKSNKKQTTEDHFSPVCESDNGPSWTPDYGPSSVWPKTNSPVKQPSAQSPTGEDTNKVLPNDSSHSSLGEHLNQNTNTKLCDADEIKTDNEEDSKKTEQEYKNEESVPVNEEVNEEGVDQKDTTESDETKNQDKESKSQVKEECSLETSSSDDEKDIKIARTDSTVDEQKQDNVVPDKQPDNENLQNKNDSKSDSNVGPEEKKLPPQSTDDESSGDGHQREKKGQLILGSSQDKPIVPDKHLEGDGQETCVASEESKNQPGLLHDLPDSSSSSQTGSVSQEEAENQSHHLCDNNEQLEEIESVPANAAAEMMDMDNCENIDSETPMDNSVDDADHQATNLDITSELAENRGSDEPMEQE